MAIWADFTKYVRSILFKNELKNGDFSVSHATNADKANRANAAGEASSANFAFEAQKLQVIEGEGKVGRRLLWEAKDKNFGDLIPEGEELFISLQYPIDKSVIQFGNVPFISIEYYYLGEYGGGGTGTIIRGRTPPVALAGATERYSPTVHFPIGQLVDSGERLNLSVHTDSLDETEEKYSVSALYEGKEDIRIFRVYQEF